MVALIWLGTKGQCTKVGTRSRQGGVASTRVSETFELNLQNPPLHNFYRFFQDLIGCKLVAINLDQPISYILFPSAG